MPKTLTVQPASDPSLAVLHGPSSAKTLTREVDAIETEDIGPYVAALITVARGEVKRLDGQLDQARFLMLEGIARFKAMRIHTMMASCQNWLAWSELSGGDPSTVLDGMLEADRELAAIGERAFRATGQATIAQVYERLDHPNRALAAVQVAEALVAPADHLTLVGICLVRSRLALADHDQDAAERRAHQAVRHADRLDGVVFLQGVARLELGRVLSTIGREEEARSAAREALELFLTKGDHPRVREARILLTEFDTAIERS